ncbi:unnamed protein product [Eruca vesicaria subsp. sativa]|uniref:F-box domain-containing protein n=1 Tax=Eruca vesicaria subsp. sativa TaxID=29727 RepID=A0ABC8K941_ERUVS|nr:unnamed protein product [Eruca vesicaria subsp. sativa]
MKVFKTKVLSRNQPWKNKKRRRREERSRDDYRSQPNHIPIDLTLEILSRLPWKSIMRYRCVSKLWSSMTKLPSFINSFTTRSTSRSPTLLVTFSTQSAKYVLFFPTHQVPEGSTYSPLYSYEITNLDWHYWRSGSIQGLILASLFKIWNPTLRRYIALPHPPGKHSPDQNGWASYLGYDPLEGKHKVLFVPSEEYTDQPLVLTLGIQESWRHITKGRYPVHLPTGTHAHGHEWKRFVLHIPCKSIRRDSIHFTGTTDAGEFIFAPYSFYQDSYILFYDPRRKTTRKVFIKRNLDEFRRRCGLDSKHKFTMQVFPNHVESLFSL